MNLGFKINLGLKNKYLGLNKVPFLYNLTLTLSRGQAPRPPVHSLCYLTLTLTLKIVIRFENKYLGLNKVRSLYDLTLTRWASPPDPPYVPCAT